MEYKKLSRAIVDFIQFVLWGAFNDIVQLPKRIIRFWIFVLKIIILGLALVISLVRFLYDLPELAAGPYRDFLADVGNDLEKFALSRQGLIYFVAYAIFTPIMALGSVLSTPMVAVSYVLPVKFLGRIAYALYAQLRRIAKPLYNFYRRHRFRRSTITLTLGIYPQKLVIDPSRLPFMFLRPHRSVAGSDKLHERNPFRLQAGNTHQVSPLVIQEWLDECDETHGRSCIPPRSSPQRPRELLLIDAAQARLVKMRSNIRYCTLSYVWGRAPFLMTTKANRSRLQQIGAFYTPDVELPKVVEDSIAIVQAIGERYLWVDALCIVQDDEVEIHRNITNMDAIYKNSLLTLVALAGEDASAPLPGIRPYSRSPKVDGSFEAAMKACRYETRGWTYQERLLSRRCVYFSETQIYLQCGKGIRTENRNILAIDRSISFFAPRDATPGNPLNDISNAAKWLPDAYLFKKYCSLVEIYMKRELSYPEDVLKAFYGIMLDFERRSQISFVCGLPEVPFNRALLWAPTEDLERRKSRNGEVVFPSWSWAGWIGEVKWLHAANSYKIMGQLSTKLVPLVLNSFQIGSDSDKSRRTIGEAVQCRGAVFPRRLARVAQAPAKQGQNSPTLEDPKANVLSFVTLVIPAHQFSIESPDRIRRIFTRSSMSGFLERMILDPNGRRCGVLYGSWPDLVNSAEFALLSWSPARVLDAHWAYMQMAPMGAGPGFDESVFRIESGLFNTLLIRRGEQFSERLAVAQIHVDAFRSVGVSAKTVRLI